jgi:hypothetical protein
MNGHDYETAVCLLCHEECEAIERGPGDAVRAAIPNYRDGPVANIRSFQSGDRYLLHHNCLSPQADTDSAFWDLEFAWWACKDPSRPLDRHAHFDQHCVECAMRWANSYGDSTGTPDG